MAPPKNARSQKRFFLGDREISFKTKRPNSAQYCLELHSLNGPPTRYASAANHTSQETSASYHGLTLRAPAIAVGGTIARD